MDTIAIRYFLDLGSCLNFSQAAEKNAISQSSFSKTIRRLETELNVQLVDRSSHPVHLTEAGTYFYNRMRQLEPEFGETMRQLAEMGRQKVLRLLLSPGSFRFKMALDEYMQQNPEMRILTESVSDLSRVMEIMREGSFDCAITYQPLGGCQDFLDETLYADKLYLICSRANPLARKDAVSLKELHGASFLETGHSGALVREICARYGLMAYVTLMSTGQLKREEAMQRIAMNRGMGIYHGRDLMPYRGFGLHCASIAELPSMPVVFLRRENGRNSETVMALGKWLRENLARYAQEEMRPETFNRDG